MNIHEAIERVVRFQDHQWVYEIAVADGRGDSPYEDDRNAGRSAYDRATVVVGGSDYLLALANARASGYTGPAIRVLANGATEAVNS